ncbi:hypothetical protein BpHYR1_024511 [Brachionus plicatilis]|uniref:Caspase family p20 domain-containing protein n=1 Tax=Brachionus plicatilis TaxID=10195 RepID=A0A3M7QKD8_BRAPC|nr:hypothetical protein BpHYR1_024511 [Brachionus plicatilis]
MSDQYSIDYSKPGIVCIFANRFFNGNLPDLPDVDEDIALIEETFENIGYEINKINEATSREIEQHLAKMNSKVFPDNSCVIVFIDSHGDTEKIYGNDGKPVALRDFFEAFALNESLEGKPILFFINSRRLMQTKNRPALAYDDFLKYTNLKADILIVYTTEANLISPPDDKGSGYFKSLCKEIKEGDQEIELILTRVNHMGPRSIVKKNLKKKFYFTNKYQNKNEIFQNEKCCYSFEAHEASIYCIHLIDTSTLASGSRDRTIKIWNLINYACVKTLKGHDDWITSLLLFDKNTLISGSRDRSIKIWNLSDYTCITTLKGHTDSVISFIKINDNALTSGSRDTTIKIWNLDNNTCLHTLTSHIYWVNCFQLKDSNTLISGSGDSSIKIWNLKDLKCVNTLKGHTLSVNCLLIIDENTLVSGSGDATIKIWDLNNLSCLFTLEAHTFPVSCIQLMDENRIVTGSSDNTIKVWNLRNKTCTETFEGHTSHVTCIQLIDKARLASGSLDNSIKIWKIKS